MHAVRGGSWEVVSRSSQAADLIPSGEGEDGKQSLTGHVFAPVSVLQQEVYEVYHISLSLQCPHDLSCPLLAEERTPCFFAQRVQLAHCEVSAI